MPHRIKKPAELGLTLIDVEVLANKEVWKTQQEWRRVFARRLHAETGKWTYRGFDWHIFSYEYREHVDGRRALAALEERLPAEVIVFADAGDTHCFGFRGKMAEYEAGVYQHDIIIADPDFRWSFTWTHEQHCGPYFCETERQ